MAVTLTTPQVHGAGWAVNAITADASGCEVVKAAPGSGYYLVIKHLTLICDANITVTIGEGESSSAVETAIVGPVPFASNGPEMDLVFNPPIQLTENKALTVDASGAGNIVLFVQGEVHP